MLHPSRSHTIKVTGVPASLLEKLDRRIRQQHATGRSEYVRELIRRDVLSPGSSSFREIFAPVHGRGAAAGDEEALDALIEDLRTEVYQEKRSRTS